MLENFELTSFIFLAVACFMAAFVDAIAGGGGLISLPAYLASGLSFHTALGTNKISASIGTVASTIKFAKAGKINWTLIKKIAPFSFIGATIGVIAVKHLKEKYFYPVVIILLILVLIYTLFNKKLGEKNEILIFTPKTIFIGKIFGLVLGFYDGFFGPGTGSFLIFGLIKIFKVDFTNASGNSKALNLASNITSAIIFIFTKEVNYIYGLSMAIIMMLGGILGTKMAVTKGTTFIKPIFLIMTTIVLIKMICEKIFKISICDFVATFF